MRVSFRLLTGMVTTAVALTWAAGGIGEYKYTDKQDPSTTHPGSPSIPLNKVPLFICLGFDDNGIAAIQKKEGATWIREYLKTKTNPVGNKVATTYDGTPMHATFYLTAKYGKEWVYENFPDVRRTWQNLYKDGHEMGNHSTEHLMKYDEATQTTTDFDGKKYSQSDWSTKEIDPCHTLLTTTFNATSASGGIGITAADIWGWRTPRLEWNDSLMSSLTKKGFVYDCSMVETSTDGKNFRWPYTLDNGSPTTSQVGKHPGLWEMPAYEFMIPPHLQGSDKVGATSLTGLDYNVWVKKDWGGKELTGPEMTDILVYTLKQRMAGNRAPLLIGLHSDIYSTQKDADYPKTGIARNRQLAIEHFIDSAVALYPEAVRIVTAADIIKWMRKPVALSATAISSVSSPAGSAPRLLQQGSHLTVTLSAPGSYTLNLYTPQGRLLSTQSLNATTTITLPPLAAGFLIASLTGNTYHGTQKLLY